MCPNKIRESGSGPEASKCKREKVRNDSAAIESAHLSFEILATSGATFLASTTAIRMKLSLVTPSSKRAGLMSFSRRRM